MVEHSENRTWMKARERRHNAALSFRCRCVDGFYLGVKISGQGINTVTYTFKRGLKARVNNLRNFNPHSARGVDALPPPEVCFVDSVKTAARSSAKVGIVYGCTIFFTYVLKILGPGDLRSGH